MTRVLFLIAAIPLAAHAVPASITHQGRLLDGNGEPIEGSHAVTVRLYDQADALVWSEAFPAVTMERGYFTVELGANGTLTTDVLLTDPLFLAVEVDDGGEFPSRQQLHAATYARHAGGVTLGPVTTCGASTAGTLRWDGGGLAVCDGARWLEVRLGRDGSASSPGLSCKQIHDDYPNAASGAYYLSIGGTTTQVYCDMTFAGGG